MGPPLLCDIVPMSFGKRPLSAIFHQSTRSLYMEECILTQMAMKAARSTGNQKSATENVADFASWRESRDPVFGVIGVSNQRLRPK